MSGRHGARWLRVVLVCVAVAAAVLVLVALVGDDGAAERRRAGGDVALEGPRATADVVLASSDAPQVAARAATVPSEEPRRAAAVGEADALRWSDVLRPVDALSGVALADVRVAHAPVDLSSTDRAPKWRALDQPLDALDLAAPGYVTVDASGHVAAIVHLPSALAFGRPLPVELRPSARLTLEVISEGARTSPADVQSCSVTQLSTMRDDEYAWSHGGATTTVADVGRFDSTRGTFEITADDHWRLAYASAQLDELRGQGAHVFTGYEVSIGRDANRPAECIHPTIHSIDEGLGSSTIFSGLPAGTPLRLAVTVDGAVAFEPSADDSAFGDATPDIVLEPGELRIITLRLLGSASVVGALPGGATAGAVDLAWLAADGTWVGCESRRELSGGEFRFDDVRPGAWQAAITWRDASAAHARVARAFEVVAGETYDLGLLGPNDGVDVTIVPRVEIDGVVDETLLGGALRATSWRFDHSGFEATASELDSATAKVLEPLVLRGILGDEFFIAFDRPQLPEAAAAHLRFVEWRCPTRHALDGPLTIEATLCLASSVLVPIQFDCKKSDLSISPIARVRALARRVGTDDVREIEGGSVMLQFDGRYGGARVPLDLGTWDVFAAVGTQSPFEEADGEVSLFGSTRIVVVPGAKARIELAPAATVVFGPNFDWRGAEPADFFQVVPADAPDALAPLAYPWPGDGITHDAAVDGLAPDTEYRVLGSEVRFRTGASGSRTVLD